MLHLSSGLGIADNCEEVFGDATWEEAYDKGLFMAKKPFNHIQFNANF